MFGRALIIWFGLLIVAILNGAFREAVLVPRAGSPAAHVVSTVLLSALIFVLAWLSAPWIAVESTSQSVGVGVLWVVLTLAFEFLAGHYLFGTAWSVLLADYNLAAGRIWPLVLLTTLAAPVLAFKCSRSSRDTSL